MEPEVLTVFLLKYKELQNLNKEKTSELSKVDSELSSHYHKIEGTKITHVAQSHKLIKELKDILERRRVIKSEAILLRMTCDSLEPTMNTVIQKVRAQAKKHKEILDEIQTKAVVIE
jgi:DNA repair exonuclease SbcCD ATPase subunit